MKRSSFGAMSVDDRRSLGRRIRQVAERVGSVEEAADAAGLSRAQLGRIYAGISAPSLLSIARLAAAARVRLEWVVTGDGHADLTHAEGERIDKDAYIETLEAKVARLEAEAAALKADIVVRVSAPSIASQRTLIGKLFRALAPRAPKEPA